MSAQTHPLVPLTYAVCVLGATMLIMHPVYLAISLAFALVSRLIFEGAAALRALVWQLPMAALIALINTAIQGFTLESLAYGACMAAMLLAVLNWFSALIHLLPPDAALELTRGRLPIVSQLVSLTMRLTPQLLKKGREIHLVTKVNSYETPQLNEVNRLGGQGQCDSCSPNQQAVAISSACCAPVESPSGGWKVAVPGGEERGVGEKHADKPAGQRRFSRASNTPLHQVFSEVTALMGVAMEDSLESADTMLARGWGSARRTTYRQAKFRPRDLRAIIVIVALAASLAELAANGWLSFTFYPALGTLTWQWGYAVHALLCALPALARAKEELTWKQP